MCRQRYKTCLLFVLGQALLASSYKNRVLRTKTSLAAKLESFVFCCDGAVREPSCW